MHTRTVAGNFQRNLCICNLAATLLPGLDVLQFTCLRQLEMHFTVLLDIQMLQINKASQTFITVKQYINNLPISPLLL